MDIKGIKDFIRGVEGWLADDEVTFLYESGRTAPSGGVILEIGSYKGKSTICLAAGSKSGNKIPVIAIDPHMSNVEQPASNRGRSSLDDFKKNILSAGVSDLVEPIVKRSQDVASSWNRPISMLWIDGDHSYAAAKRDFELFFPYLVPGGIVAFHDSNYGDVKKVVERCLFSSNFIKKPGLIISISFGTKTDKVVGLLEKTRNIYILVLNQLRSTFRKVPLPAGLRSVIKRNVARMLSRELHQ